MLKSGLKAIKVGVKVIFSPKYLLFTNTVTCGTLLGVGDILQQTVSIYVNKTKKDYDFARTVRMAKTGIVLGPMNHYWYQLLDAKIKVLRFRQLLLKTALDLFSCPMFSVVFVSGVALQEGVSLQEGLAEYREKWLNILSIDLLVWPPSQMLNFWFLPPQTRVLFISSIQVFYNACISCIKHDDVVRGSRLSESDYYLTRFAKKIQTHIEVITTESSPDDTVEKENSDAI